MSATGLNQVIDNKEKERFELHIDGHTAFAAYRVEGTTLVIDYVEAPPPLRGTCAAGRLMEGITTMARDHGQKIYPICSYAVSWMNRHPDQHDVLA